MQLTETKHNMKKHSFKKAISLMIQSFEHHDVNHSNEHSFRKNEEQLHRNEVIAKYEHMRALYHY